MSAFMSASVTFSPLKSTISPDSTLTVRQETDYVCFPVRNNAFAIKSKSMDIVSPFTLCCNIFRRKLAHRKPAPLTPSRQTRNHSFTLRPERNMFHQVEVRQSADFRFGSENISLNNVSLGHFY